MTKKLSPYCNNTYRRAKIQNVKCKPSAYQTKAFNPKTGEEQPLRICYWEISASDGSNKKFTNREDAEKAFEQLIEFEKRQTCIKL